MFTDYFLKWLLFAGVYHYSMMLIYELTGSFEVAMVAILGLIILLVIPIYKTFKELKSLK